MGSRRGRWRSIIALVEGEVSAPVARGRLKVFRTEEWELESGDVGEGKKLVEGSSVMTTTSVGDAVNEDRGRRIPCSRDARAMAAYVRLREAKKGLEGVIMSAVQCPLSHSPVHLLYLQGCLHCRDPTINCRLTDVAEAESSRQATTSSGTAFFIR